MQNILGKFNLYLLTHRHFSSNSILAYIRDINQFYDFLQEHKKDLHALDAPFIKAYLVHMHTKGLAVTSRRRKIESLRLFFRYLTQYKNFPEWDQILVTPQVEKKLPHYLSRQEIKALLKVADENKDSHAQRNQMIIYLLYATGLRISELLMLKQSDIVFNPFHIRVMGKGKKERLVPLPHSLAIMLKKYMNTLQSDYLFTTGKKNELLTRQNAALIVRAMGSKAKIQKRLYPHLLRHSYATHMLENGANIRHIQSLLGHESLRSTEIYTHVDMTRARKIYDKKHLRA